MVLSLFSIALFLLNILWMAVVVQVIFSWLVAFNVINLQQPFVRALYSTLERILEPLYRPVRKLLPDFGGIDFSPIIVIIAIRILMMFVSGARDDYLRALM